MGYKGFTLIELLVVMSITGMLFAMSFGGLLGFQQNQNLTNTAVNILSAVNKARVNALNAYVENQSDGFLLGYIYTPSTPGAVVSSCIYEWYDVTTGSPLSSTFNFNGTLSDYLSKTPPITINLPANSCPNLPSVGSGYSMAQDVTIPDSASTVITFGQVNNTNVGYLVFENLTGKAYVFDTSGNIINITSSTNLNINISMNGLYSGVAIPLTATNSASSQSDPYTCPSKCP